MSGENENHGGFPDYTLDWLGRFTEMGSAVVRRFNEDVVLVQRIMAKNKQNFKSECDAQSYVQKIVRAFVESVSRTTENLVDVNVEIIRELNKRHPTLAWPYDRKDNDPLLNKWPQNKSSKGKAVCEKDINAIKSKNKESSQIVHPIQTKMFSLRLVRCDSELWPETQNVQNKSPSFFGDPMPGPSNLSHLPYTKLVRPKGKKREVEKISVTDSSDVDCNVSKVLKKKRKLLTPKDSVRMKPVQIHTSSESQGRKNKNTGTQQCKQGSFDDSSDMNYSHRKTKPGESTVIPRDENQFRGLQNSKKKK